MKGPRMSWIIKNKQTGEVMLEIFSQKLLARLNTEKYEAVPVMEYLCGVSQKLKEAALPGSEPWLQGQLNLKIKARLAAAEKSEAENG